MIHRLKKEGIIYVLIFCTNQITVAGVNPFGIALAVSAISSGYKKWPIFLVTLLGNGIIYANELVNNMLVLIIFSIFHYIVERNARSFHYITKTMFFLSIYSIVQIIIEYKNLNFINMLILILEIVIATTSCLVFNVGISYIVKKDITREMNLQEKISVALIITFLGVYIIQVRDDNITPLKLVILYLLSFIGTVIYKTIVSVRREKNFQYGNVYSNLVYNKLSAYSDAIKNMSKSIKMITYDNKQISYEQGNMIFEKISQKYCATCDRCSYCWEKEFDTTYEAANIMIMVGMENGVLTMKDVPKSFMIRCKKGRDIVEATNINLEMARNNIWWQAKVDEMKKIMSMQLKELAGSINQISLNMYKNIALDNKNEKKIRYALKQIGVFIKDIYYYEYKGVKEIIMTVKTRGENVKTTEIASEISDVLYEKYKLGEYAPRLINSRIVEINLIKEENYKMVSSCITLKKEDEQYCGDNYSIVEDDIADVVLMLSDGMGSGKEAYQESKKTIEMVEEFLSVGFSKDVAVNLVNSAMYLNCGDINKYSTLDICIFNRYTGRCDFIKVGATSTFIKRGTEVIEVTSDTLPIGIFNSTEYKSKNMELYDGDIIVMMTDGLGDSMPGYVDWKEELIYIIKNINTYNPNVIGNYILNEALSDGKIIDDISIIVGVVWRINSM